MVSAERVIFFGLFNFGEQLSGGAAILITGFLIDWFAGLIPGQAQQSAETITAWDVVQSAPIGFVGYFCTYCFTVFTGPQYGEGDSGAITHKPHQRRIMNMLFAVRRSICRGTFASHVRTKQ